MDLPEPPEASELVSPAPARPTISRRGALAFAGAGSALVGLLVVGQSIGGPLRRTALLAPHGQEAPGPDGDFQINKTAAAAEVIVADTGPSWRLKLDSDIESVQTKAMLSRDDLLGMELHTVSLPIACVEGWSTDNQTWTGIRLRDLAAMAGVPNPSSVLVQSLQRTEGFSQAVLSQGQILDPDSLLALRVNGADLTLDHGYPARIIVPACPGVHCTKWVTLMSFRS